MQWSPNVLSSIVSKKEKIHKNEVKTKGCILLDIQTLLNFHYLSLLPNTLKIHGWPDVRFVSKLTNEIDMTYFIYFLFL